MPCVTVNRHGRGSAWYAATRLAPEGVAALAARACERAGVTPVARASHGLELVRRSGPAASYLFAINHEHRPAWVEAGGTDLLTGAGHPAGGRVEVPPRDLVVLRTELAGPAT